MIMAKLGATRRGETCGCIQFVALVTLKTLRVLETGTHSGKMRSTLRSILIGLGLLRPELSLILA